MAAHDTIYPHTHASQIIATDMALNAGINASGGMIHRRPFYSFLSGLQDGNGQYGDQWFTDPLSGTVRFSNILNLLFSKLDLDNAKYTFSSGDAGGNGKFDRNTADNEVDNGEDEEDEFFDTEYDDDEEDADEFDIEEDEFNGNGNEGAPFEDDDDEDVILGEEDELEENFDEDEIDSDLEEGLDEEDDDADDDDIDREVS